MSWLENSYHKALLLAAHPRAVQYLCALSTIESIILPIPPDAMLIPMALSNPQKGYYFASLTMFWSVVGGIIGYGLGYFAYIEFVEAWISQLGYLDTFQQIVSWYDNYGIEFVILAGFTPIPYKLVTISAGCVGMPFLPFIIGSFIGRGARFYLLAFLAKYGKTHFERVWLPRLAKFSKFLALSGIIIMLYLVLKK